MKFVNYFKNTFFPMIKRINRKNPRVKVILKVVLIVIFGIFLFKNTFSWLYEEYVGNGAVMNIGKISHLVTHYDEFGNEITDDEDTMTLLYETNISNITKGSKYIRIENDGTLDLEYTLSLSYEGTVSNVGVLYYRIYEITSEVKEASGIKNYAENNKIQDNVETDATNPVKNMSLINNEVYSGTIELDPNGDSCVYYRIDYGMYQTVNTALYSSESMSLHFNVYSTQIGATDESNLSGQIWQVSTEEQLREILISASNGDKIQLVDDISVAGTLNIGKRINLDTNDFELTISGDLVYDFANMGELLIDVSDNGKLIVDNNLYINTPKAEVSIVGGNKSYDIVCGGLVTLNGIQDGEKDGIYLENLNMVKSETTLVPVDPIIRSNTRLTLGANVTLGTVSAEEGSTNIEVINNGNIIQLDFSKMSLLTSFTKAQIYVYNLGNIYGIIGSTGIILPSTSTPYLGPNNGNTWIVKGVTSNDITVSGSDSFGKGDIEDNFDDVFVVPISGEDNAYIVYIKDSVATVEQLLYDYFLNEGNSNPYENIIEIRKLVIYTLNAQYFENEDFDFLKGDKVPYLEHLDLSNSRVIDGDSVNSIKSEALKGKLSLKVLILPNNVTKIGDYAFYGINLGVIPNDSDKEFYFMSIPATVNEIGDYAFSNSEYVYFSSNIVPNISSNTFDKDNVKVFVNNGCFDAYMDNIYLPSDKIYQKGVLSDDRKYFVFEYNDGVGISYAINDIVSTLNLGIPTNITLNGTLKKVLVIGINSYRHMNIYNESGVSVSLASSVRKIDDYAFYGLNIVDIDLSSVSEVKSYAFYNTNISNLVSQNMEFVGDHAFENTDIEVLSLSKIDTIGAYAFNNVETMHSAYLYNVSEIGDYAFNNCKYLNKVYFTNTNTLLINNGEAIDISVGENATFSNWGFYTDGRLRVYVPDGKTVSGNTYLSLYQSKFSGNENYIFVTGNEIGTYTHMALPYDINIYTVREVTLHGVNGWEIISYQGADLDSEYKIPESLTYNGVTKDVISIGDYAYRNVIFLDGATIKIDNSNLVKLGNYALSNMDIVSIKADSLVEIGQYALYGTKIQTAEFKKLETLGDYALAELLTLNMVNLGTVKSIGYSALYNDANLEQVYFNNTDYDIVVLNNAFYNVSMNASNRFRMYVPSGETSINYYKTLFVNYEDYVYETGIIVGSYINAPIMYDIGEYSVKEVTLTDRNGNEVTGYELIEYHGANLSNLFELPDKISLEKQPISVTTELVNSWPSNGYEYQYNIVVKNTSDKSVGNWKVRLDTSEITISNIWNYTYESFDNYVIISGNDAIAPGGSITILIQVNSSNSNYVLNASYYNDVSTGNPLISIGSRAFVHTETNTNTSIVLNNKDLLNISNYAFYNVKGITSLDLPKLTSIGEYAFYNNDLNTVSVPELKSVGKYAFSNMASLYYIDLGKVNEMKENSLYNLNNLLQVFFTPTDDTIVFDNNSINNVGSLTDDRIRFYVRKKTENVLQDVVTDVDLSSTYTDSYSRQRHTITVTISNPTNKDVSNWSLDMELGSGSMVSVTSGAKYSSNGTKVTFTSDGSTSTISALGSVKIVFVVSGNRNWSPTFETPSGTSVSQELFESNVEYVNIYKNSFNEKYRDYFYTKGEIIGNYTPANIPFEIGEYSVDYITYEDTLGKKHYGFEIIEWHGGNISSDFTIPDKITVDGVELPLISIGDYGFRWANMQNGAVIDINSSGLLRIDDYAFYNIDINVLDIKNVDVIGDYAFYDNVIYTAEIPNLKTLGDYAFAKNSMLNYINLGYVNSIGKSALEDCTGLEQIFFKNTDVDVSTTTVNMTILDNAFNNIATEIGKRFRIYVPIGNISSTNTYVDAYVNTLPSNLSNYIYETGILINDYNYSVLPYNIHEFSVKKVTINDVNGYEIIEYHGPDITSSFSIPDSITIDDETLPVISIGDGAYVGVSVASNETWNLVIPQPMMVIGDRAFYQTGISSIYSTATLESIGKEAFAEMPNLTNVNLGTVKYIYEKAFYLNKSLTTVRLGTGVQYIGNYAFYNTYNDNKLERFYIATEVPPTIESNTFPGSYTVFFFTFYNIYFYVPRQSLNDYKEATYWSNYANATNQYINASSELYDNTYYYTSDDTNLEVTIVEYIGNSNGTLTIPDTFTINNNTYKVTGLKSGAFDSSNVTTLVLPRYLSYVEEGFLSENNSVININVSSNNTMFSSVDGVLYDYSGETLVRYPKARTTSEFTLNSNTRVLANSSFVNSTSLTKLNFNSGLLAIGSNVFTGSTILTSMNFTSVTPPYLMGFNSFPINYNLVITYPSGSDEAYLNNLFYNSYINYLRAN